MEIQKGVVARSVLTLSALSCAFGVTSCQQLEINGKPICLADAACGKPANVCLQPTVLALAQDLDELENHIEKFGSVVAKQPDVWGQARLTKHREEFEQQMAKELGNFVYTLQGSLSRSDQAYFADAMALSAAASSRRGRGASASASSSSSTSGSDKGSEGETIKPLDLPDQSDTFAAFSNISRTDVTKRTGAEFEFAGAKSGIMVEPAVFLDQKARFLNHLNELRRINEGDDTSDSPGYALNLVRVPVSVLPGKCTDVGHGGEITMTLTPYLSDELLPTTFRNLILNDLVDQIGFPVTRFLNDGENRVYFAESRAADVNRLIEFIDSTPFDKILNDAETRKRLAELRWTLSLQQIFTRPEWAWVDRVLEIKTKSQVNEEVSQAVQRHTPPNATSIPREAAPALADDLRNRLPSLGIRQEMIIDDKGAVNVPKLNLQVEQLHTQLTKPQVEAITKEAADAVNRIAATNVIAIPATKARRARLPFPPSQMAAIYGYDFLFHLGLDTFRVFARERIARPCPDSDQLYIHLPDVQGYLQEEIAAAYKFLSNPHNLDLWQQCTPELAIAIRSHRYAFVDEQRKQFRANIAQKAKCDQVARDCVLTRPNNDSSFDEATHSTTAALAWAIIVEASLLTEQLVQDMREASAARGCACLPEGWLDYFSPTPSPEARQAFNDYVRCRWPIHVFALDPAAQQQNLADVFSGRREMQLAMSLAFVNGEISARNMMRYARRIEFDFATVDLNGTAIGFSHGNETFGWRFYPRFQTPDIESNATVLFRDLIYGGPSRNALLRQRRLEPGIRECVAVVIMPSFVPYATLDVSSSWFKLTNPKAKHMDSKDAMQLSQRVKSIQNCVHNVVDAECYRDGDFARLIQKARQLETRLPLQSAMVQIPYENTLGGFAMFNTGVTDLAPELTGWYGSPSINPKEATTVFLVGNHFSVHQTKVIAGGQNVSNPEMLSRQVIKVTIPPNFILSGDACQKFVDVHLATPYGVTQHLLIPVCAPKEDSAATGTQWKPASFDLAFAYGGLGIEPPAPSTAPQYRPPDLIIQKGDIDPAKYPQVDVTIKFEKKYNVDPITLPGITFDQKKGGYVISGDKLQGPIFARFGAKFGPETTNPPCQLVASATELKFLPAVSGAPVEGKTVNALSINWIKSPQCCVEWHAK